MPATNRWCILGSPRTGSNLLEEAIFLGMPKINNGLKIGLREYLGQDYHWYYDDSGEDHTYQHNYEDEFRINFRKNILNTMISNPDTGFVLRVFFEPWFGCDKNYIEFLKTLEQQHFNFIKLKRNLFDKIISLTMSHYTNLWQRTINGLDEEVFAINGNRIVANKQTKVTIPLTKFAKNYYYYTKMYDYYFDLYSKDITCFDVNYETMEEDCKKLNIPFSLETSYIKTYKDDYADIIENYRELKDYFEELKQHG